MDKLALGVRIHEARKVRGLTSDGLAGLCGVGPVHIRKIESGAKLPSIPLFVKLCNALNISPNYLLQDSVKNEETRFDLIRDLG